MSAATHPSALDNPFENDDDPDRTRPPSPLTESDAALNRTITRPGAVKINVEGAFILDSESDSAPHHGEAFSPSSPPVNSNPFNLTLNTHSHDHDISDIVLPRQEGIVSHIAVDIGGSLAKLVWFSHAPDNKGGRLNFFKFETGEIESCFEFIRGLRDRAVKGIEKRKRDRVHHDGEDDELCVVATGGGAYKYFERMREVLEVEIRREDEMECLIAGLDFFISEIPAEVFSFSESNPMVFEPHHPSSSRHSDPIYPYLLVNIGSGVSIIKVTSSHSFVRVGGTSLGGGTLWGLLSLLTGANTFDEMLSLADKGDNTAVDMLVGDIYGTDYGKIGLSSTTIASSMGKVFRLKRGAEKAAEDGDISWSGQTSTSNSNSNKRNSVSVSQHPLSSSRRSMSTAPIHDSDDPSRSNSYSHPSKPLFSAPDISRSLLYAVSNNIGQIAYLHAEKHALSDIYFGGSFIRGHRQTIRTLSNAIKFWSGGTKRALFLRHEGYLGATGAFLKRGGLNRRASFSS